MNMLQILPIKPVAARDIRDMWGADLPGEGVRWALTLCNAVAQPGRRLEEESIDMVRTGRNLAVALIAGLVIMIAGVGESWADQPVPWQMGFQEAVTPVMEAISGFHDFLLVLITVIVLFVFALMVILLIRFNAKSNPKPSRTTHHTMLEVAWTVIPIIILVIVAVPSFRLLYQQRVIPEADLTVKAIGYQWYWGYEYPDHDELSFDSVMLADDELEEGEPRLLATDTIVVVPVNKVVKLIVTAGDVIHAWTIPAFGVKIDAVPGRLNEAWFKATRTGVYYGQCSELCGRDHAFMPIEVHVVTEEEFAAWIEKAKEEFAAAPPERHGRGELAALPAN